MATKDNLKLFANADGYNVTIGKKDIDGNFVFLADTIDGKYTEVNTKIDTNYTTLDNKITTLDTKVDNNYTTLDNKITELSNNSSGVFKYDDTNKAITYSSSQYVGLLGLGSNNSNSGQYENIAVGTGNSFSNRQNVVIGDNNTIPDYAYRNLIVGNSSKSLTYNTISIGNELANIVPYSLRIGQGNGYSNSSVMLFVTLVNDDEPPPMIIELQDKSVNLIDLSVVAATVDGANTNRWVFTQSFVLSINFGGSGFVFEQDTGIQTKVKDNPDWSFAINTINDAPDTVAITANATSGSDNVGWIVRVNSLTVSLAEPS